MAGADELGPVRLFDEQNLFVCRGSVIMITDLRIRMRVGPLTLSVGLILSDRGSFFYLKSAARSLQPENSAAAAGTAGKG
jgi:hypothetical protein